MIVTPLTQRSPAERFGIISAAVVLAGLIGFFAYSTGYDFHVAAFYLVPICWAGWTVGRRAGMLVAIVCTVIWLVADLLTGHRYRHPLIPYWNSLMLLAFFAVIVYALSTLQDLHLKLLEAQGVLKDQNEHLEETVRQRTAALEAEIAERKLMEKAKLQAERLAMVGTIAAQVAHEVRNPLGSITLNLDLITKEIEALAPTSVHPAQEGRILVREMREEVRRIQRVIEDYLRFARLPKLHRTTVKLNEFLEQKLGFMGATFEAAGIRLRTDLDPGVNTVDADTEQLWEALLNLVRNSLEAMPGGGTLSIATRREDGEALLQVGDSGKGMTRDQLGQLFVPFYTTKPRGTGLGLPLTLQILNEHKARIECESEIGAGTWFTIHLPLNQKT